ncbi:MAG TPA: hypothetical protein VJ044_02350 [Candidatus Hodarchaeales archaeon]|nr:hypothetical protein [Candidatus Hodarchaeales archaeon]
MIIHIVAGFGAMRNGCYTCRAGIKISLSATSKRCGIETCLNDYRGKHANLQKFASPPDACFRDRAMVTSSRIIFNSLNLLNGLVPVERAKMNAVKNA